MAETFKNALISNVDNASDATLYTAPSGTTTIILGVAIANKTATDSTALVKLTDSSTSITTELIPTVTIPSNTTLEVLAGQKYILETGDILKIKAGHASTIDVTIGVLEIS